MLKHQLLIVTLVFCIGQPCVAKHYDLSEFSRLANKNKNFAAKLNSSDNKARNGALVQTAAVLSNADSNTPEYRDAVKLLKQMLGDSCSQISEQALQVLISEGVTVKNEELPVELWGTKVCDAIARDGYLKEPRTTLKQGGSKSYAKKLGLTTSAYTDSQGAEIGWSAQKIGILGGPGDISQLKTFLHHDNVFVRYSTANALRNLGDSADGLHTLSEIAGSKQHYYSRKAAQVLSRCGIASGGQPSSSEQTVLTFPGMTINRSSIKGNWTKGDSYEIRGIDRGRGSKYTSAKTSETIGVFVLDAELPDNSARVFSSPAGLLSPEQLRQLGKSENPWILRYCAERGKPEIVLVKDKPFVLVSFVQASLVDTGEGCRSESSNEAHAFTLKGDKLVHLYLVRNQHDNAPRSQLPMVLTKFVAMLNDLTMSR